MKAHIFGKNKNISINVANTNFKIHNKKNRGRNWKVKLGQIGLRCKHCYKTTQENKARPKSSHYFPLTLSGIYQAAQNIYHFHFKNGCCPCMPQKVLSEFNNAKSSRSCYGGGKQYWIIAAESLGITESASGLCFQDSANSHKTNIESIKSKTNISYLDMLINDAALSERSLVNPEDRNLVTDYIFIIMCQMVQSPGQVDKNDRDGSNCGLVLCCRHCMGDNGKGIFNRTKVTSISKNEYFNQVHSHLESCSRCPDQLKVALGDLKKLHEDQKRKLKR